MQMPNILPTSISQHLTPRNMTLGAAFLGGITIGFLNKALSSSETSDSNTVNITVANPSVNDLFSGNTTLESTKEIANYYLPLNNYCSNLYVDIMPVQTKQPIDLKSKYVVAAPSQDNENDFTSALILGTIATCYYVFA